MYLDPSDIALIESKVTDTYKKAFERLNEIANSRIWASIGISTLLNALFPSEYLLIAILIIFPIILVINHVQKSRFIDTFNKIINMIEEYNEIHNEYVNSTYTSEKLKLKMLGNSIIYSIKQFNNQCNALRGTI